MIAEPSALRPSSPPTLLQRGALQLTAIMSYPELTTERLRLRAFAITDADDLVRLAGERVIAATTLNIPHPYTREYAEDFIAKRAAELEAHKLVVFAVTLIETGEFLGAAGLQLELEHSRAELGYWIGRPHWGSGYATEAAGAVLQYAFDDLKLNRVFAGHFAANPPSGRVLEKIGMLREGTLLQHVEKWNSFEDIVIYAVTRSEYEGEKTVVGKAE